MGRKTTFPASWRGLHASIGPVLKAIAMLAGADSDRTRGVFGMKWSKKATFGPFCAIHGPDDDRKEGSLSKREQ
jgi:hypothetical protein